MRNRLVVAKIGHKTSICDRKSRRAPRKCDHSIGLLILPQFHSYSRILRDTRLVHEGEEFGARRSHARHVPGRVPRCLYRT